MKPMRTVTSIVDLLELTKTDVRYKWLIIAGYVSAGYLGQYDIFKVYYEDALNWMLEWIEKNVQSSNVNKRPTCRSMVNHINYTIVNIIDRNGKVLKPEFNIEPMSKNTTIG